MVFNIATKSAVDTADIKIIDPDTSQQMVGEGDTLCSVTVHGPASKPYLEAQSVYNTKLTARYRAKGKTVTTADEDLADKAAFLSDITISFNGFDYNGAADRAAYRACYADPALGWLTNQVNTGSGDWSNFTPGSSTS